MESQHLQQIFFQELYTQLPGNISLADEVSDALRISIDGAYRRIRGEKLLSFEEIQFLASRYRISVDHLFSLTTDTFSFTGSIVNGFDFTYENWLKNIIVTLENICNEPNHYVYYFAKEIPFPYYFFIPEIAAFKSFFFMKSIFYSEEWKDKKFSVDDISFDRYKETWSRLANLYTKVSSAEIWNVENVNSFINQILMYSSIGAVSQTDAIMLLEKLDALINHIELQAEQGKKVNLNQPPHSLSSQFNMYINNLIVGDNTIMVQQGDVLSTYLVHSVINFLNTADASFNSYMKKMMGMFLQKSTPISIINESKRSEFFDTIRNRITTAKLKIN